MGSKTSVWVGAALLAAATSLAQESKDPKPKPEAAAARTPGPRLRVQFVATRQHGDQTLATRPYTIQFHADDKPAKLFVGSEVPLSTTDKGQPTLNFKYVGVELQASAKALPDGRYSLDARFEESSVFSTTGTAASSIADNPILKAVKTASRLTLREGETVPFATVVDPMTGDRVRVDVTLAAPPPPKPAATATSGDRIRVQLALTRRKGDSRTVNRSYSVVLQGADNNQMARVFSGSQLPIPFTSQGQTSIALKDVGAGSHMTAERLADGRYRLELYFSDGTLAAVIGNKPSLQMFNCDSVLVVRHGEAVPFASGVDAQTGEVVEVEATVEVVR